MDVGAWLRGLGLEQYAQAFAANDIDRETLPLLSADDLRELGVGSLGHRAKLMAAIARLRAPPPAPATGERRQVTVLFADLCGFTALSRSLDAEDLHALVARYTAAVDEVIERHGGTVDKHIGDAVMALFGAPVAHGDDPRRAALAGLAIHAAMVELSADLGRELRSHVGIATGQVVAGGLARGGTHDYTVLGDAVNLASRLEGLARPGETLISDDAWRAVGAGAEGDDLGEQPIKGLDAPVRVWRLRAVRAVSPPGQLVGRARELAGFDAALDDADGGIGGVFVLRGEPGIGKSRLLDELAARGAARGFTVHRAFVLDFGAAQAQGALALLTRSMLGAREPDDVLRDLLGLPLTAEALAWLDAMTPDAREQRRHEAIAALAAGPVRQLLCVEDVHWADRPTLAALRHLGARLSERGSLLVLTTRSHGDPLDAAWRDGLSVRVLDLGLLDDVEARALAGTLLPDGDVVARCLERAGGHPLFLEQLLRHARDLSDGIPGTIQSLVLARIDRLGPADRALAQTASVLGQRVERAALAWLLERESADTDALVAAGLLRDEGDALRFAHALVQEGVYGSLLKARRRELHTRAASWYATRDLGLRAGHLDRADHPEAAPAHLAAAQERLAAMDRAEARRLAERGLAVAASRADRFALACLRAEVLRDLAEVAASEEGWRAALTVAEDDPQRARAWIGLASVLRLGDRTQDALDALDRAQEAASPGALRDRARIHYLRGNVCFSEARIARCREEHERAIALAREARDHETEAGAWSGLADVAYAEGRMVSARDGFRRAQALGERHGHLRIAVAGAGMAVSSSVYLAPAGETIEDCARLRAQAYRLGDTRIAVMSHQMAMISWFHRGRPDLCADHARQSHAGARALRSLRFFGQALEFEARALLFAGDHEQALRLARQALDLLPETGTAFGGARVSSLLARLVDDPGEQAAALAQGEQWLRQGSLSHAHLWFRFDAIELGIARQDPALLRAHAYALEAFVATEPLPWARIVVDRARALARHLDGEADDALRRDLEAVDAAVEAQQLEVLLPAVREALASLGQVTAR